MADTKIIEITIRIDAEGNWALADDDEEIDEKFNDRIGSDEVGPTRDIKIKLNVALPRAVEIIGDVPEEKYPGITLKIVEEGRNSVSSVGEKVTPHTDNLPHHYDEGR